MKASDFNNKNNKLQELRKNLFIKKIPKGPSIYFVATTLLFLMIFLTIPLKCTKKANKSLFPTGMYISAKSTLDLLHAHLPNLLLLNVSHPSNYQMGFIHGSMLIPPEKLYERIAHADKETPIIIYSYEEEAALKAYALLKEYGLSKVWIMEGGIEEWITSKYPLKIDLTTP